MRPAIRAADRTSSRADTLLVVIGALTTGASSTLMHLSGTTGPTVAFFRCLYALPVLLLLAGREVRRRGLPSPRDMTVAVIAGIFLALDLVLWFDSIQDIGAGLATVVQDTQVVFVAGGTWLILGARPSRRLVSMMPVLLAGIVLISGALGAGWRKGDPLGGTATGIASAIAYAVFLLLMGWRPQERRDHHAAFFVLVTAATALAALVAGACGSDLQLRPAWPSAGWLLALALSTQVFGWLVISQAMLRLTTLHTAIALLLQPVAAVLFAWAFLGQHPNPIQLVGVAAVTAATLVVVTPSTVDPGPSPAGSASSYLSR